jgi:hypothetical protein
MAQTAKDSSLLIKRRWPINAKVKFLPIEERRASLALTIDARLARPWTRKHP